MSDGDEAALAAMVRALDAFRLGYVIPMQRFARAYGLALQVAKWDRRAHSFDLPRYKRLYARVRCQRARRKLRAIAPPRDGQEMDKGVEIR